MEHDNRSPGSQCNPTWHPFTQYTYGHTQHTQIDTLSLWSKMITDNIIIFPSVKCGATKTFLCVIFIHYSVSFSFCWGYLCCKRKCQKMQLHKTTILKCSQFYGWEFGQFITEDSSELRWFQQLELKWLWCLPWSHKSGVLVLTVGSKNVMLSHMFGTWSVGWLGWTSWDYVSRFLFSSLFLLFSIMASGCWSFFTATGFP